MSPEPILAIGKEALTVLASGFPFILGEHTSAIATPHRLAPVLTKITVQESDSVVLPKHTFARQIAATKTVSEIEYSASPELLGT